MEAKICIMGRGGESDSNSGCTNINSNLFFVFFQDSKISAGKIKKDSTQFFMGWWNRP